MKTRNTLWLDLPSASARSTPAWISDDLPDPDGPNSSVSRCCWARLPSIWRTASCPPAPGRGTPPTAPGLE